MPEGHTIHRLARDHRRWFVGQPLDAASPQGRFEAGARALTGRPLAGIDAWGKHLFYRFDDAPGVLHVHLGLFGRFRMRKRPATPPRSPPRLVLGNAEREVRLSGPTACELLDDDGVARLQARLGPDPLRDDADGEAFVARAATRRRAAGALLMDQREIAGIGNVYRSELLFLVGVHPRRTATDVGAARWADLWALAGRLLTLGVTLGRIVTVDPAERGRSTPRQLARGERQYVYKRSTCLRCATPVERLEIANRTAYACPTCQGAP